MREKIIYANVNWFTVSDDQDFNDIPNTLKSAKALWDENGNQSNSKICNILNDLITCNFLAENMSGWENYFVNIDYGEFKAEKVTVLGVDFTDQTLPSIRAEAWIKVQLKEGISDEQLDEWIETEWGLVSGIMWSWDLPNENDLDLFMEENKGVEAVWVEKIS